MKPNPSPVRASVRKRFADFFSRSDTQNGLGIATDGSFWDIVRGAFRILGQRANAVSDPSQYPIATVNMPFEDVRINLTGLDSGSAAALWVTDAGDWWGVGVDQHPVDCNCSVGTECNRWNASTITGWTTVETGGRNSFNFISSYNAIQGGNANTTPGNQFTISGNSFTVAGNSFTSVSPVTSNVCTQWLSRFAVANQPCISWTSIISRWTVSTAWNASTTRWNASTTGWNATVTNSWNATTGGTPNFATAWNAPTFTSFINGWNAETCNRWNEFLFDCSTCYPQWVRIFQSASSTVTTIVKALVSNGIRRVTSPLGTLEFFEQDQEPTDFVRSMDVSTRGQEITVRPFKDDTLQEVIQVNDADQLIHNATGSIIQAKYGIMVYPSEYNQGNYIGGISITDN